MKLLVLGSHAYTIEHFACMNLRELGHEVMFYGYKDKIGRLADPVRMTITRSAVLRSLAGPLWLNRINDEIIKLADRLRPDVVLSVKGEVIRPETIMSIRTELGLRTALWYPDDPRFFNSLVKHIAPSYDFVFTASEKAIGMYKRSGVKNVYYLPFACEPSVHRRVHLSEREHTYYSSDICFVGTYTPRRAAIVGALRKAGLAVRVWGPYWKYFVRWDGIADAAYGPQMVKIFNGAKIVLNVHVEDDLPYKVNMRTFEVAGCGAFLLTDESEGMKKMFRVGEELAAYHDQTELIELAQYYLDAQERSEIAEKAQHRAYSDHTYERRMRQFLDVVRSSKT